MKIIDIKKNIEKILDNNKAANITSINLKNKSYIADYMIKVGLSLLSRIVI